MHALWLIVASAAPGGSSLPLKSLVLYENGLGYFERRGTLAAGSVAEIPLEPGQLDDALKSLVVVSPQGVASVEFAPPLSAEAARAVAGLPPREAQASLGELCRSLAGVEVEVRRSKGTPVRGRVIEVASENQGQVDKDGKPVAEPTLLVFGTAGLAQVPLRFIESVQPLGRPVEQAWSRAVGATSLYAERERLLVRGATQGGSIAVGYTTEAPVWRTTYRLVLGKKNTARLQGYALVHNDSDESWNGVRVTLASGRPASFLLPLAGPRYGRRELISPEDGLDSAPQLATAEARGHLRGENEWSGSLSVSGSGSGGGGYGAGMASGVHGGIVGGASVGESEVTLSDGPTPLEAAAVSDVGDLFLYAVKTPVVLGARKSALLPIIDGSTEAENVSVLDEQGEAFTAVRLENTTSLTLEGGTVSVFSEGIYAGETQLDRLKPGEVRVLKHGKDLDLEVSRTSRREQGAPKKARVINPEGRRQIELTRVDRVIHSMHFVSRTSEPKVVLVALSDARARVVGGAEEDVRSPEQPRYGRVKVAAHAQDEVELVEETVATERISAETVSSDQLRALLALATVDDVKRLLTSVLADVQRAEQARAEVVFLDGRLKNYEQDLVRVREDLTAVGKTGATEAARKLADRLIELELSLNVARREREAKDALATQIRRQLSYPVNELSTR